MKLKTLKVLHGSDVELSLNKETAIRFQLKDPLGFFYLGEKEINDLQQILDSAAKKIKKAEKKHYKTKPEQKIPNAIQLDLLASI